LDNINVTNKKYTMKNFKKINSTTIMLDNKKYKGYTVGELPKRFAFIYNEDNDQEGITEFFNYQGLTYVEHNPSIWSYV
jgi:hypothetical protein